MVAKCNYYLTGNQRINMGNKPITKFTGLLCLLCCLPLLLGAQTRSKLEQQRQRLLQEIKQTTADLDKTKQNKAATLDQFLALQNQIQKRRALIRTLRDELDFVSEDIAATNDELDRLASDLARLKKEYATTIQQAYRLRLSNSYLLFIFSADSFNDAYRRWQYMKQYDNSRKRQAQDIVRTQDSLTAKGLRLEQQRKEKEALLASQQQQNQLLNGELSEKNQILQKLNTSEGKLVATLNEQQQAHDQLNDAIEAVIRKEMAERARAGRASGGSLARTPDPEAPMSSDFSKNKGALPWPVKEGAIIRNFGRQPHPQVPGIQITNNGIDIRSQKQAKVYPIFAGSVVGVQFIPGYQNTVIVKHGKYYTAYSNLAQVFVARGDEVAPEAPIGKLGSDKPEVHFEVWLGKKRLNPVVWVAEQ